MTELTLTKFAHACVTLETEGRTLLLDPGVFAPNAADLLAGAAAVLITHDHVDHLDVDAVRAAVAARPDLAVFGPAAVAGLLGPDAPMTVVAPGDTFRAAGLDVRAVGREHAPIHADLPAMANVGYVVEGVYHPGDAYAVPDTEVDTLLLPTGGPWARVAEAVDLVRAVRPRRTVQIHDGTLNEVGRQMMDAYLGVDGLTGVPLLSPEPGQAV
jgi:L-ascorbate metabolism protein UlaG (beta-lactamase superfamily)